MPQSKSKKTAKPKATAKPAKARARKPASPDPAAAGGELVDLTPDEIRRLPRPRDGFEQHVGRLLETYAAHHDELAIRTLDPDDIRARFGAWQILAPVEKSAEKHLEMVQETRILHASKVWSGILEIYAKAQVAGRTNPDVRRAIADFAEFMKTGPRKKATGEG